MDCFPETGQMNDPNDRVSNHFASGEFQLFAFNKGIDLSAVQL